MIRVLQSARLSPRFAKLMIVQNTLRGGGIGVKLGGELRWWKVRWETQRGGGDGRISGWKKCWGGSGR